MSSRGRAVLVSALATLTGLLIGALGVTRSGYQLETTALDRYFPLRYQLFGAQKIDPRLVIVGVDAATVDGWGKPLILWQSELALLIEKLKAGRPAAIGLDILISPKTEGLPDDDPLKLRLQDEAMQLGLQALAPPPLILAEQMVVDERNRGPDGEQGFEDDQRLSPHEVIRDLLLQEDGSLPSFGIVNIATDIDGAVRRGKLFISHQGVRKAPDLANFAFRLLEAATHTRLRYLPEDPLSKEGGRLTWQDENVPFLFGDSFLLNFPGPTEDNVAVDEPTPPTLTFPIVSALDVMAGKVPADSFKDKIVIVAGTAGSLGDEHVVPGDSSYHGAAIHATVINMFLTNSFLVRSTFAWMLTCAGVALLGAVLGRQGKLALLLLTMVLIPLLSFLAFSLLLSWLPCITAWLAFLAGGLMGYTERLFTVERDRARVRSTFARMVSPQVMRHVLNSPGELRHGVRKEITVLFTDINDFTPVCEKHEPEEVIEMLSDYFSKMVDVIMKYDGYLKQYVGDEIMVIFGAPDEGGDHATRAVLTALEMRDVLAKAKAEAGGKPGFYEIKAGINTGSVVVGKVGPESRWEYAAVGDNVNLGARVMSAAQKLGLDIGVSEATRARYQAEREASGGPPDPVEWLSQGEQTFKGKISRMEIFAVQRRQEDNL